MPEPLIPHDDIWIDPNGVPAERRWLGGQEVIVHYDDIPESDITLLHGIRCTTALRTVIDIAPEVDEGNLAEIVGDCLDRNLFTVEEAHSRLAQADMVTRVGARLLRTVLSARGEG